MKLGKYGTRRRNNEDVPNRTLPEQRVVRNTGDDAHIHKNLLGWYDASSSQISATDSHLSG